MSRVKAGILEEFEKTRTEYEDLMERARLTSKAKLREKKEKRKNKKGGRDSKGGEGDNGEDEDDFEAEVRPPEDVSETEEIRVNRTKALFEEAVDSFLDDPIVVHKGLATNRPGMMSPGGKGLRAGMWNPGGGANATAWGRKVVLDPLPYEQVPGGGNHNSSSSNVKGSQHEKEKRRLKEEEDRQQQERERIKAEHAEKEKDLIDGLHSQMSLRKHTLQERLRRKREAREQLLTAPVGSYAGGGDAGVAAEEEEEMALDDIARLEQAFETVVSLVKSAEGTKLENLDLESLMTVMERVMRGERLNTLADTNADGAGGATGRNAANNAAHVQAQRDQEERVALQEEVKRISNVYNEEKQKFDLMMKIQQARQRQTLQRKLMERKQQLQHQSAAVGPTLAAQLGDESSSSYSLESPKKAQLDAAARAGTQGLASRGLHLGPIMRK